MTRDDIIRIAEEAGFEICRGDGWPDERLIKKLMRFVALVAAAEREWCAKLVEPSADHLQNSHYYLGGDEGVELLLALAETIRSRGKNVDS